MLINQEGTYINELKTIGEQFLKQMPSQKYLDLWKGIDIQNPPPQIERIYAKITDFHFMNKKILEGLKGVRIMIHKIYPFKQDEEQRPGHAHPWPLATHIKKGGYEMTHTNKKTEKTQQVTVNTGDYWEMNTGKDEYRLIKIKKETYSVCLVGEAFIEEVNTPKIAKHNDKITKKRIIELIKEFKENARNKSS